MSQQNSFEFTLINRPIILIVIITSIMIVSIVVVEGGGGRGRVILIFFSSGSNFCWHTAYRDLLFVSFVSPPRKMTE